MMRDVLDVALALTDALNRREDEARASGPHKSVFAAVLPATATFLIRTVEGKQFRVTVQEEER